MLTRAQAAAKKELERETQEAAQLAAVAAATGGIRLYDFNPFVDAEDDEPLDKAAQRRHKKKISAPEKDHQRDVRTGTNHNKSRGAAARQPAARRGRVKGKGSREMGDVHMGEGEGEDVEMMDQGDSNMLAREAKKPPHHAAAQQRRAAKEDMEKDDIHKAALIEGEKEEEPLRKKKRKRNKKSVARAASHDAHGDMEMDVVEAMGGGMALKTAVERGMCDAVDALLKQRQQLAGQGLLHALAEAKSVPDEDKVRIAEALLSADPSLATETDCNLQTALHRFCELPLKDPKRQEQLLDLLHAKGGAAIIHTQDAEGWRPLHVAAASHRGHHASGTATVKWLCGHGGKAHVNEAVNVDGDAFVTPLSIAAMHPAIPLTRLRVLIEEGGVGSRLPAEGESDGQQPAAGKKRKRLSPAEAAMETAGKRIEKVIRASRSKEEAARPREGRKNKQEAEAEAARMRRSRLGRELEKIVNDALGPVRWLKGKDAPLLKHLEAAHGVPAHVLAQGVSKVAEPHMQDSYDIPGLNVDGDTKHKIAADIRQHIFYAAWIIKTKGNERLVGSPARGIAPNPMKMWTDSTTGERLDLLQRIERRLGWA
ncbi:unnamed protein product [Vitrella brassicaformis CCMP3155]|uniref:Uncharacterized protein n=1 Tax=Vitrella brassicaformis (strain CCMP3155) TaxID=1169540 RepID=A0A0G4H469_VITBC|nr:unnamed protein product [Vitrella brassicaformis CCMP3155]|eukprot:CEM38547.1 unnamed protein product [Vitrella brassicaformis CCMP3155]